MESAEETVREYGRLLNDMLYSEQREILRNRNWDGRWREETVYEMLYTSVLFKYNGSSDINPVLKPFIEQ